jgi:NAD(P)-dependent dehydrogenase (short-subunit alcohol dehydrogenase family)
MGGERILTMRLQSKVAVVIGGTSGIGQAVSRGFLREGAKVVATGSNPEKVAAMAEEVKQFHAPLARPVDTRDSTVVAALFAEVRATYGSLDIVVNCAGTHLKKPSLDVSDDEWKRVMDINLNGMFYSCREAGKIMTEQRSGSIVNVASLGSFVALTDAAAYCASKAGVVALTKSLAVEWATLDVRVNAIVPGVFQTALNAKALSDPARRETILRNTPMKRFGNVEELVGGAVYLASDAASFTTGSTLVMDGGFLALGI